MAGAASDPVAASFDLILASCAAAAGVRRDPTPVASSVELDPAALLQLARWHRILPFVCLTVVATATALPAATTAALNAEARTARMTAITNAAAEAGLASAAAAAGLDVVFVKGATLAHLLYRDPFAKSSWDIDLLIAPADLALACAVLRDLGYALDCPPGVAESRRFDRWLATMRETTWRHRKRGTVVELHIGLSETPAVLAGVGMHSPRQLVTIAGVAVPTLAEAELFAFLCVHGAHHGWGRLKWLTDAAALITASARSVTDLRAAAIAAGAGRCGDVALLLCHQLFGLDLPDALAANMLADRATRRIMAYSLSIIDRVGDVDRHLSLETVPEILANLRNQYRFQPGLYAKAQTFWAGWNRPYGTGQLWLPKSLLPIAMIVWLPLRVLLRPLRRKAAVAA